MAAKRGRPSRLKELLSTLIDWAGGPASFASSTGIRVSDQNHYLAGRKGLRTDRLRRAAQEIFGTPPAFLPIVEREELPAALPASLRGKAGVYALFSSSGSLIYFGKATDLFAEIRQTLGRYSPRTLVTGTAKITYRFRDLVAYFSAYEIQRGDAVFRHDVEALILRVARRDTLNTVGGHFGRP
jgi:hypothetical protein